MISLDSETTGKDFAHGARPFFVTTYNDDPALTPDERIKYWEWDVDPLTRIPIIPKEDARAIRQYLALQDAIVLQNAKFDAHALLAAEVSDFTLLWELTHDTLVAGHVLASNQPHNLTAMALIYCDIVIDEYEKNLEIACSEARKLVKANPDLFYGWRIATAGLPELPSCKVSKNERAERGEMEEKPWRYDMWLPRAIAKFLDYPKEIVDDKTGEIIQEGHPWWTVLSEYSNADSEVTMYVWKAQEKELHAQGLWKIYERALKVVPVTWKMELNGASGQRSRMDVLQTKLTDEAGINERKCLVLADGELENLPNGSTSNALKHVIFDTFGLVSPKLTKPTKKGGGGNPSMDKHVMEYWEATLDKTSPAYHFIKNLRGYNKRRKAIGYLDSYRKFIIDFKDLNPDFWMIYGSVNVAGTDTTRFSCVNPNLQQISKQDEVNLREIFGPLPGREWYSLDAANIELRIPAFESGEQELIDLFERETEPPFYGSRHLLNFSKVYPDIWAKAIKEVGIDKAGPYCKKTYASSYYQWGKNGGLALQYNCGDAKADETFHREGSAKILRESLSKLAAHNAWCISFARKHGYIETIPRKNVDPEHGYRLYCSRGDTGSISPTIPLAYRTQGTAGEWIREAMVEVSSGPLREWNAKGFDAKLILTVHDELVFDLPKRADPHKNPKGSNLWRVRELQRVMQQGGVQIGIPTPVNIEYHPTHWGEKISL